MKTKTFILAYQFGCDFNIYMERIYADTPLEMLKIRFENQNIEDCKTYKEAERILNEDDISINYFEIPSSLS